MGTTVNAQAWSLLGDGGHRGGDAVEAALDLAGIPVEDHGDDVPSLLCVTLFGNPVFGGTALDQGLDRDSIECKAAAMTARGYGRLVLVTDDDGAPWSTGSPQLQARFAADRAWWQNRAVKWARHGVWANTVRVGMCPALGHRLSPSEMARRLRYQPIRRPIGIDDIAVAIRTLAEPRSSYMVGETLEVDGGAGLRFTPSLPVRNSPVAEPVRQQHLPEPTREFEGRTILVTGASSGVGREICLDLADRGADLVLSGRDRSRLEELAHAVTLRGRRAWGIPCDLDRAGAGDELVAAARDAAGAVHGLVYGSAQFVENAGTPLQETEGLTVNLFSYCSIVERLVCGWLADGTAGSVVAVSSVSQSCAPVRRMSAYSTAKAAIAQYTRGHAATYARSGLRFNTVAPGLLETTMSDVAAQGTRAGWTSRTPAGRLGRANEVAPVTNYLLSNSASAVTGTTVHVDGGFSLGWMEDVN